ncbi:MAG: recombinase family protein [Magnetococcales bacterium]|nr:recombinase family protein [Magnetococcales bacterium]MBF0115515.1 recombinase family protein [Magnetococcales bacterium]
MSKPNQQVIPKIRCAIYTRKSTEEGLDMDFNSLDAQRDSCEAYIASQKNEGWILTPDRYDDGGFSGGNVERPALKRLMADVESGKINMIVLYKLDRLTRSLLDFAKLVEAFDRKGVSFVSVTQHLNTSTSMGRLTINMMMAFAQFEREIASERIRDKFAASKKRGMWMGGHPPLGYDVLDRKLVINEAEAETVRTIFHRFIATESVILLLKELTAQGATGKFGRPFDKGAIYRILGHHVYVGEVAYQGEIYVGEHQAILDRETWEKARTILAINNRQGDKGKRVQSPTLLKGIIRCQHCNRAMKPTFTHKNGRQYRYYTCQAVAKGGADTPCNVRNVAAGEIEAVVMSQVRSMISSPEVIVNTWEANDQIHERDVADALRRLDPVWDELFPVEQQRLVELLVSKVDVSKTGVKVHLRAEGIDTLARELNGVRNSTEAA